MLPSLFSFLHVSHSSCPNCVATILHAIVLIVLLQALLLATPADLFGILVKCHFSKYSSRFSPSCCYPSITLAISVNATVDLVAI